MKGGKRPGAGRPKNSANKATAELKAAAQKYTVKAVRELARIAGLLREGDDADEGSPNPSARVMAIKELFDRGHGKSAQILMGSDDPEAAPIKHAIEVTLVRPAGKDKG